MKRSSIYIAIIICCVVALSCEMDNYEAPDATIEGAFFDHNGQPLQLNHGSEYIRMRELSWAKDEADYIGNRRIRVQQDGTYRHTKQFAGQYRMFPIEGNFYPYYAADDEHKDGDNAGELVNISGVTTQNFSVTPYLTIEWVEKPKVDADGHLECTVRFTRNQKTGYAMPDVRNAMLYVSRTINPSGGNDGEYFSQRDITNALEGTDIVFRTRIPLKYTGINYWIRVAMNCQTAAGNTATNYPGMGQWNCSTIEKIFVP